MPCIMDGVVTSSLEKGAKMGRGKEAATRFCEVRDGYKARMEKLEAEFDRRAEHYAKCCVEKVFDVLVDIDNYEAYEEFMDDERLTRQDVVMLTRIMMLAVELHDEFEAEVDKNGDADVVGILIGIIERTKAEADKGND